jgi:signal transduction histidine kinase
MLLEQLNQVADLVQTTSSYSEGKPILRMLNVSLNSTFSDYTARVEQLMTARKCQLQNEFDKDVTVKLDVKEFFQSYQHIVKNACDAMPDGGKIVISTKRADKKVEIYFKDNGLGISEGIKDKIFEPFMTFGKKEGTGLGLSITKKIIEAHDGTIQVKSALGEGTTFIVTLPIASIF